MREYMVLEARTGPLLTKLVNEKIAYGWTPIGGVSVAITDNNTYGVVYAQAVERAPGGEAGR